MKTNKKKLFWKYLLGGLAGAVLCGAVVGGVVSCSNGSTTATNNTTPSSSTTTNTISDYALTDTYNTSTIAYKNAQTKTSMVATNSDVANYSTLANEPGNLAIYTNGSATPTAIINSANATNTTTTTILNLTLQKDSALYNEWENGKITNLNVLAQQLGSLISFVPTEVTDYTLKATHQDTVASNSLRSNTITTSNNTPLNLFFAPNNAQWGYLLQTNGTLFAALSTTPTNPTMNDYITLLPSYEYWASYDYGVTSPYLLTILQKSDFQFSTTMTINYSVANTSYSDVIQLNVSLQPYFSYTNDLNTFSNTVFITNQSKNNPNIY